MPSAWRRCSYHGVLHSGRHRRGCNLLHFGGSQNLWPRGAPESPKSAPRCPKRVSKRSFGLFLDSFRAPGRTLWGLGPSPSPWGPRPWDTLFGLLSGSVPEEPGRPLCLVGGFPTLKENGLQRLSGPPTGDGVRAAGMPIVKGRQTGGFHLQATLGASVNAWLAMQGLSRARASARVSWGRILNCLAAPMRGRIPPLAKQPAKREIMLNT